MNLIPNWRQAWRWWSVRVSALAALLAGLALAAPDLVAGVWQQLPADLLARLPANIQMTVPLVLAIAQIVARLIKQRPASERPGLVGSTSGKVPPRAAGVGAAIAATIAAAALIVTPFTAQHEGTRLVPYRDLGGVLTVCNGETRVEMRSYTAAECQALLSKAITSDYAPPVLACVPELAENRYALAASIDAAYNAGAGAFCRSPAAARFRLRQWAAGCQAFNGWRATVQGKPVRGLANRRRDEAALCARGAA